MITPNATIILATPGGGFYEIGNDKPLTILAGPCAMESRDHALMTAERLKGICERVGFNLIYKSSYDKANRTSAEGHKIGRPLAWEETQASNRQTFDEPTPTRQKTQRKHHTDAPLNFDSSPTPLLPMVQYRWVVLFFYCSSGFTD